MIVYVFILTWVVYTGNHVTSLAGWIDSALTIVIDRHSYRDLTKLSFIHCEFIHKLQSYVCLWSSLNHSNKVEPSSILWYVITTESFQTTLSILFMLYDQYYFIMEDIPPFLLLFWILHIYSVAYSLCSQNHFHTIQWLKCEHNLDTLVTCLGESHVFDFLWGILTFKTQSQV